VVDAVSAGRIVRDRVHTKSIGERPRIAQRWQSGRVLVAVLIVVVALCWVQRDEDRSRRLV
jgi:hypothetical protein